MNRWTTTKIFVICIVFFLQNIMLAQDQKAPQKQQDESLFDEKTRYLIEVRLEQPGADTARYFILQQVRRHCGNDDQCQYEAYYEIMIKLEMRFNIPMAIFVGEEMVKVAQRQGNLRKEANTYRDLSRYHDNPLAFKYSEKALRLFKQLEDGPAVAHTQMVMLEHSLSFRKFVDVLPEMEALLDQAISDRDTSNATQFHVRLIFLTKDAGMYEKMEEHVEALEKIPVSDPVKSSEYYRAIIAAMGRADLLMVRGKLADAAPFYQKALRLCEDRPDRWLEIIILYTLSDLEWERENVLAAKSYLNKAQQKAEDMESDELLTSVFERKAKIAEAERRYADALEFTKKHQFHDKIYQSKSAGFNIENYYLQQDKEQLATQQRNQELELRIKKTQLRNSLLITALVILLTIGLLVGLQRQRKAKQKLAAQNALIQQQSEQLKSLDAAKSRFFANASHELRTPLTLILGPIQSVLQESNLSEKQTRLLNTAHQSGKGLQTLVNEILDLQKLEMGKMEVYAEPTLLSAFFNRYAAQFESLAQSRHIDFRHETNITDDAVANIDREKCRQILYNLLSNAFKFTPAGGHVKLTLEIGDTARLPIYQFTNLPISITVSDSGPGIPPEDLPRVFDRYFQSCSPGKPAEGGTGIGLALCHEYTKLFGGTISVESTVGKGSVFSVEFPVTLAGPSQLPQAGATPEAIETDAIPQAAVKAKPVASPEATTPRPTLLVVEDNLELQDYIRLILKDKYNVVTAENGKVALEILAGEQSGRVSGSKRHEVHQPHVLTFSRSHLLTRSPALILSDLMMPVMDGYQFLEKLKSDDATHHIPVIMLTARAEARDRLKALRIGVDDYLTKPFDEEELLVRIENLLANSKNRQTDLREDKPDTNLPVTEEAVVDVSFVSETDRVWLESFEAFVQKNIANEMLNIPLLASEFAMSESTLLRQLKRLTGLSPVQYLQEVRLDKARHLLENRSYDSISKVAGKVGYSDLRSFSRSFKQRFGKLPSDFLSA